jgi:hypothetical protein
LKTVALHRWYTSTEMVKFGRKMYYMKSMKTDRVAENIAKGRETRFWRFSVAPMMESANFRQISIVLRYLGSSAVSQVVPSVVPLP